MKLVFARRFGVAIALAGLGALLAAVPVSAAPTSNHYTGTLPDHAVWIADVPSNWNHTLILYSHGFGPLTAADAPDPTTQQALLGMGYALAGSSYDPNGSWWALGSAVRDQFETLARVEHQHPSVASAGGVRVRHLDGRPDQRTRGSELQRTTGWGPDDVRDCRRSQQPQPIPARR